MSNWDDTLSELSFQARQGKTARILIDAAKEEISRLEADSEIKIEAITREKDAEMAEVIALAESAQGRADELSKDLKSVYDELMERKISNPKVLVEDSCIQFRFTPNERSISAARWYLDELESVITYLRVNGGVDSTVLYVDDREISVSVEDPGFVPVPHRPLKKETEEKKWWNAWPQFASGAAICGAAVFMVMFFL